MIKHHIVYSSATDYRFDLAKAEGSYLWDAAGKRYIDFSSGWNTTNLGWNHPEVNEAVARAAAGNVYAPMWTADEAQSRYAANLLEQLPQGLNAVCRATGGTEANEMALKIARAVTGRKRIISFAHTYHGQSFGTLALGYIPEYIEAIAPLVPEFIQMTYPTAETLQEFLGELEVLLAKEDIAAVFTEPGMITGWGSMLVAPDGFLAGVRTLTAKYGTLLVIDEVGTGFSRTGKLFGMDHYEVVPDIMTFAKGISNGASPIGAVAVKGEMVEPHIAKFKPTSTFGWTPLACAAADATLSIHLRDKIWEQAERKGQIVRDALAAAAQNNPAITNIRGRGLELAFDLRVPGKPVNDSEVLNSVIEGAFKNGLHLADAGASIQLMPPLTIADEDLEDGLEIFIAALPR